MDKQYLWEKLGATVQQGLLNENVFEIMLNPDGKIWFKETKIGNYYAGQMEARISTTFIYALAQHCDKILNDKTPFLDVVLPFNHERLNATIPPITENISFNIRKKSKVVYTLADYVDAGILSSRQSTILETAIWRRKNILISGSPASGKTTLANALLDSIARVSSEGHRVIILEQVSELQCNVKNVKMMLVSEHISLNQLLWISVRNAPDRIVIGEVRDGSALDMLKAWNTGCRGGIATIHANHSLAAIQRVLDLSCEKDVTRPLSLAAEVLDVIVQISEDSAHQSGRRVSEIFAVTGFDQEKNCIMTTQLDEKEYDDETGHG